MEIGDRIRFEREELGYSQRQLAGLCEISPQYLGQIEKGRILPRADLIDRLSGILGVTADYLIRGGKRKLASGIDPTLKKAFQKLLAEKNSKKKIIVLNYLRSLNNNLKKRTQRNKQQDG